MKKLLRAENERMKDRYRELKQGNKKIEQQMKELEDRDNEVYRSIFEATPIPDSARLKELEKEQQIAKVEGMEQEDLINSIVTTLNNMSSRINAQKASYKDLGGMVKDKEKLLAATPAIQPVSNADLKRIASGFGYRIDPVYKTVKLHPGLISLLLPALLFMLRLMAQLNLPATAAMDMAIMLSSIMAMVTKLYSATCFR
jgi:murein DD-endopeptidase MepM/ murein hydrolase activator NlpD